jgi:hypothetical protein
MDVTYACGSDVTWRIGEVFIPATLHSDPTSVLAANVKVDQVHAND